MIDRIDGNQLGLALEDILPVALDGFHDVGRWTQAFIRDRRIEGRKIDWPHRLRTKYNRIEPQTFAIYLCFDRKIADPIETGFGLALDPALEKMRGRTITRIFERLPQGQRAASAAVVILWRPIILLASLS